jgi:SUKH-3 immunity protein
MTFQFSEKTCLVLKANGWFSDREIDISSWRENILQSGGLFCFEVARKILMNLGRIEFISQYSGQQQVIFAIDPLLTTYDEYDRHEQRWEIFQEHFYPIGLWRHDSVFCTESGLVFLGDMQDNKKIVIGNTIEEALEYIISCESRLVF